MWLTLITDRVYAYYMNRLEDFLTPEQISEKMGFKVSTILTWCRSKVLNHYKVGGQIRILESDVVLMIEEGRA